MTRATFFITLAVSLAAAAQQPPALPLPDAAPKEHQKKKEKQKAPPALPLPGAAAAPALPLPSAASEKQQATPPPPLPLPAAPAQSADTKAPPPLPMPEAPKPAAPPPPATAQKPPPPPPATAQKPPPPAAPKAAPASDRPAIKTLTAQGEKPGAAPLANALAPIPADMRLRPDFMAQLWSVRGFVGAERSTEQSYTDAVSASRLGVEATRWFSGTWLARGELDWRTSRQGYVPLHAASGSGSAVMVDENRFDVSAGIGYDFGPKIAQSGRFELTPMIGVHYVGIRNDAFPSDLIGPEIGGRVRYALSTAVIAHAQVGYTYNLSVASTQNSALKSPLGDFQARAGLALPLSGGYALELDYSGDVLGFQNTYRVAHGAALAFGTSF